MCLYHSYHIQSAKLDCCFLRQPSCFKPKLSAFLAISQVLPLHPSHMKNLARVKGDETLPAPWLPFRLPTRNLPSLSRMTAATPTLTCGRFMVEDIVIFRCVSAKVDREQCRCRCKESLQIGTARLIPLWFWFLPSVNAMQIREPFYNLRYCSMARCYECPNCTYIKAYLLGNTDKTILLNQSLSTHSSKGCAQAPVNQAHGRICMSRAVRITAKTRA